MCTQPTLYAAHELNDCAFCPSKSYQYIKDKKENKIFVCPNCSCILWKGTAVPEPKPKTIFTGNGTRQFKNNGNGGVITRVTTGVDITDRWMPCELRFQPIMSVGNPGNNLDNYKAYLQALEDV